LARTKIGAGWCAAFAALTMFSTWGGGLDEPSSMVEKFSGGLSRPPELPFAKTVA
jgi:hypothetical protein